MKLFGKKTPEPELPPFAPEDFEPVIRASICTGEKVACMREKASGKLHELMLIRTEDDKAEFCRRYGLKPEQIKTVY